VAAESRLAGLCILAVVACGPAPSGGESGTASTSTSDVSTGSDFSSTNTFPSTSTGTRSDSTNGTDDETSTCEGTACGFIEVIDGGTCFAGGTRVATPEGDRAIETLRVGDEVYAYDVEMGVRVVSRVDARFVHPATPVLTLTLGGRTLRVTGSHPVYQPSTERYVRADRIEAGDALLLWESTQVRERMVETSSMGDAVPVYNISVAGLHNYFAEGVLVHNKSRCNVWTQDCPEGHKCMPWANDGSDSWSATKCVPVDPNPGQPGDPCTVEGGVASGVDSCDVGSMCWSVDPDTLAGTCLAFCTGSEASPSCDDPNTTCSISHSGALVLCLPSCDPFAQNCPAGEACYRVGNAFVCWPAGANANGYGGPCESFIECEPGLFCADAARVPGCRRSPGCCSEFCDLTSEQGDSQCSGVGDGQQCVSWFEEDQAPEGYEALGGCVIPD
jgi:hypothetical protein